MKGALYGTRLLDQPAHAAARDALLTFLGRPGPMALDVGFDHGARLLDHARAFPETGWLGCELRRRRVLAVAANAGPNCLPVRLDARTLLGLVPPGRLSSVEVLFPTPFDDPHRRLFSDAFVAALARSLAPGGVLVVATDVDWLAAEISGRLSGWREAAPPPTVPTLSRRDRVCRRDGLAVHHLVVTPC